MVKSFVAALPLGVALFFVKPWESVIGLPLTADLIIAIGALLGFGVDLGGMSSTLPSSFDPLMARIGVRKAFNIEFAGSVRTDLLLDRRRLVCDHETCIGCETCVEICPRGVWAMGDEDKAVVLAHEKCTACKACLVQCPTEAISARGS
jgi:NAD-dependent dihydropyrimidine dehydrogenase PreA subunit